MTDNKEVASQPNEESSEDKTNVSTQDAPKASAEMKNGLLKISVPFADESKPKTLQIK